MTDDESLWIRAQKEVEDKQVKRERLCLKCEKIFKAKGNFNRVCRPCKDSYKFVDSSQLHSLRINK